MVRCRIKVTGAVQGVGFRPFVYRLATSLSLAGWVRNSLQGVEIEVEGKEERVREFLSRLVDEAPPAARIYSLDFQFLPVFGYRDFEIRYSTSEGNPDVFVLPDIATCRDCLRELFDPSDRRYRYPFINCTNCGPRFTIIERLPYDRPNTTMKEFKMCTLCEQEYNNPEDRRFHAQPNACWECGPQVWLEESGRVVSRGDKALRQTAVLIEKGKIVAVKGIGGFHLVCLAESDEAVQKLRERKKRVEKPFAVMFSDLLQLREFCSVTDSETHILNGPERPIVLLKSKGKLPVYVSGGLKTVGAFFAVHPVASYFA